MIPRILSAGFVLFFVFMGWAVIGNRESVVSHPAPDGTLVSDAERATHELVRALALVAFPAWKVDHPGKKCPPIAELLEYTQTKDPYDPWSGPYIVLCGKQAPKEARPGIGIVSKGRDALYRTSDDLMSWKLAPSYEDPSKTLVDAILADLRNGEQNEEMLARVSLARSMIDHLAMSAFPGWAADHPEKKCPSLPELLAYTSREEGIDPWGEPYRVLCGERTPRKVRSAVGIVSNGPDRRHGTRDDIESWAM